MPDTFASGHVPGTGMPGGKKTRQRSPDPMAKASEAHVPEPKPEKHADGDDEGKSPTGQDPDGKATHNAWSAPATARTQAIDRAANAPGPLPNDKARKIRRPGSGQTSRTVASTPRAQPTTTSAEESSRLRVQRTARSDEAAGVREPEKPITEAADSTSETEARENDEASAMRQDR